jgi:error-prone DNA polymerase
LTAAFSRDFAHLHVRSGFSYEYGTATPEELAGAATCMNMGALALTDRDGLYGIPRLLKVAEGTGVSPIVGTEVSVAEPVGGHVVLLAEGNEGYRSLCRLVTSYRCSSKDKPKPLCPCPRSRGMVMV